PRGVEDRDPERRHLDRVHGVPGKRQVPDEPNAADGQHRAAQERGVPDQHAERSLLEEHPPGPYREHDDHRRDAVPARAEGQTEPSRSQCATPGRPKVSASTWLGAWVASCSNVPSTSIATTATAPQASQRLAFPSGHDGSGYGPTPSPSPSPPPSASAGRIRRAATTPTKAAASTVPRLRIPSMPGTRWNERSAPRKRRAQASTA